MEMLINENTPSTSGMVKTLIATLYNTDSVVLGVTRIGPDRLYLLVNKEKDEQTEKSLKVIQDTFGKVIEIKVIRVDVYDVVGTATAVVEILDIISNNEEVHVNITSGRKTMALGLLFGSYARASRVKSIQYGTEESKMLIRLPVMSYNLTDKQKDVLNAIKSGKYDTTAEMSDKIDVSKAMLYKAIKDLQDMGMIVQDDTKGYVLTDAGKIGVL
jgi:CRISPR-associated protein Csa3